MNKRTIFIGDIHGCYDELKLLIKKLELNEKDKVYFVGDYINKGPKSFKVLKLLYKNRKQFKGVLGNHEVGFMNWLKGKADKYECKIYKKLKSKLEDNSEILDYLKKMPYYIEEKDFILVHGGIDSKVKLSENKKEKLISLREIDGELWYKNYFGDKKIIYGHNAVDGLQIRKNTIGLDSGCVYGKFLTAYILETGEVYTQGALNNYINIYK